MIEVSTNAKAVSQKVKTVSRSVELWCRYALGKEADDFRSYVRNFWLRGRALKYVTGETYSHVDSWIKGSAVYVRPGVGVSGWQNYLCRWIDTDKEFMRPAFKEFSAFGRVEKAVKNNIDKMMERVCEKQD